MSTQMAYLFLNLNKMMNTKLLTKFGIALTAMLGLGGLVPSVGQAVQLADGTVYFIQPPRLVEAATSRSNTLAARATYYFTVAVPENSGEPLQRIVINQRDSATAPRRVLFNAEDSFAFVGTRDNRGTDLSLGETVFDRDTQTISLTFDPPVPAGTTVTVGLRPRRNPQIDGTYLFRVEAFPPGDRAHGQVLGFGRLRFDSRDRPVIW